MPRSFSATDTAIRFASIEGTLRLEEKEGRFGLFVAIGDQFGLIEVADNMASAEDRVRECV